MLSIDSETTGLHYQHGVVPFTFGYYDGNHFSSDYNAINPKTRRSQLPWRTSWARERHEEITSTDAVVFQNARFDVKALCVAGVFDWDEPGSPDFWANIIELSHLSHLFDSRDSGKDSSLKVLAPKYLGVDYSSEKALNALVIRCRNFCKDRTDWKLANEENVSFAASSTKWPKLDMWLPRVLRDTYHDQKELARYMGEDYEQLHLVVDDYLKADCIYTYDLAAGYISQLDGELTPLLEMNTQLAHVLWKIETLGLCVSGPKLRNSIDVCDEWKTKLMEICVSTSGIEPGSKGYTDAQLRKILFDTFEMEPLTYTAKKQLPQVDAKTLLKLKQVTSSESPGSEADKFLAASLAYTKYETKQKYLQSYNKVSIPGARVPYVVPMKDQVFLFPSLKDTGTGTTRFSSNDPNSQNIEKAGDPFSDELPDIAAYLKAGPRLRECFTPPPNHWWFPCDYSQLQLRIFAAATQEPQLIQAFRDGWDFHDFIAHVIFDLPENVAPTAAQRRVSKNCNFGFIFGASEKKIDTTCGRKGLYSYLMEMFPNAHDFIKETKEKIQDTGVVHTLGGYPLHIPLREFYGQMSYAAHSGVNYIVQGTEGEIVKKAMFLTDQYLTNHYQEGRLVMQIHDEIVFQLPARPPKLHVRNLCKLMEDAGAFYGVETPVDAEVCFDSLAKKRNVVL
jgi:DNA polymerase I-like protein with 3'-5' exonuclease and polymerase domains